MILVNVMDFQDYLLSLGRHVDGPDSTYTGYTIKHDNGILKQALLIRGVPNNDVGTMFMGNKFRLIPNIYYDLNRYLLDDVGISFEFGPNGEEIGWNIDGSVSTLTIGFLDHLSIGWERADHEKALELNLEGADPLFLYLWGKTNKALSYLSEHQYTSKGNTS